MRTISEVGVIVGRFQLPALHEGHLDVFEQVMAKHEKVLLFLGAAHTMCTIRNPLDYQARRQMILAAFPKVSVFYIKDHKSDWAWSKDLDKMIGDNLTPSQSARIYGSRDSCLDCYHGKYLTTTLTPKTYVSASKIRDDISKVPKDSIDFRAGVIWATYNQYPKVWATVDIAIYDTTGENVLVGRKKDESGLRFVGGFSEPNSFCFEDDAAREAKEETGVIVKDVRYIGSYLIDDWRYRNEADKIKTLFFVSKYESGKIEAADDLAEVQWVKADRIGESSDAENEFEPEHRVLVRAFNKHHALEGYRYRLKMD